MKSSIWILTAVVDDYDQPDHDLIAWWHEKPSCAFLAEACGVGFASDDDILNVVKLHQGEARRMYPLCRALFELREVVEGVLGPSVPAEPGPPKKIPARQSHKKDVSR